LFIYDKQNYSRLDYWNLKLDVVGSKPSLWRSFVKVEYCW